MSDKKLECPEGIKPGEPGWVDARQRWREARRAKARQRAKLSAIELDALKRKWREQRPQGSKK